MEMLKNLLEKYTGSEGKNNFYHFVRVIDINDPLNSYRIKVRIKGVDDKLTDDKLPWCSSFLPIFANILPKKDEMVKVILLNPIEPLLRREWIGPIIASQQNFFYESYLTALSNSDLSNQEPEKNVNKIIDAKGVYPDLKDIALIGRDNTDIILKEKEVLIRAGKHEVSDTVKLNTKNPSYIQLKYSSDGKLSTSSIVGDKICLISNNGNKIFNKIIDDVELKRIIDNAYSAVYAEPLIDLLKLIQDFVANHIHPMDSPPNRGAGKILDILSFDLNKIKAINLKIN